MTKAKNPSDRAKDAAPPADEGAEVVTLVRRPKRRCPVCGQTAVVAYRPFCSSACADRDLGRWLNESYRVPAVEEDDTTGENEA